MSNTIDFDLSSLSDGQVRSKLWLIENFEALVEKNPELQSHLQLGVLASWYGFLPLFLFVRNKIKIKSLELFEIEPRSLEISRKVLEHWWIHGLPIQFHCRDVNEMEYEKSEINLFINTACEHISGIKWFQKIPDGTWFIFQSTNMKHEQHVNCPDSLQDFAGQFRECKIHFCDELEFNYPDKSFKRFMIMGKKG